MSIFDNHQILYGKRKNNNVSMKSVQVIEQYEWYVVTLVGSRFLPHPHSLIRAWGHAMRGTKEKSIFPPKHFHVFSCAF